MKRSVVTIDGNEAAATIAHKLSEVIAIFPITPSTTMAELADQWSAEGRPNLWGSIPTVIEMQSEGGAVAAVHGALQSGVLSTTFTASQGLLLMIPTMYKLAGELTSTVFHVTARALATHALSIFGDHSDIMSVRSTGFALIASSSVQEAHDIALIAHAATLEARVPFLHFFDGFRTSHEINRIEQLSDDDCRAMIDDELVRAHRARALTPDRPFIRGTAQNPDVFFQAREASNPYYLACPAIVQRAMDRFASLTDRHYQLYQYEGAPDAERVIVVMGSAAITAAETVRNLVQLGEKVGVVNVRLYRPFSAEHFVRALPTTVRGVAVLDRSKDPGAVGEPLYEDVVSAINDAADVSPFDRAPRVVGGRYGLSSKEFTPAMVKGVFDELSQSRPKNHFSVGIVDDVTHNSIDYDPGFSVESDETVRCVFWGLGSDGTVGANKNSIKIIGEETGNFAQGYFVYDSKKSGSATISHLRFGPSPVNAPYLVAEANFVGCHQFSFLERFDVLKYARPGAVFLLNSIYGAEHVWDHLPGDVQHQILDKQLRFYVIDAYDVARKTGMGGRINTIMQTCFFAISDVLPKEQAIAQIKHSIEKTYGKRGEAVVRQNFQAVDDTLANLYEVNLAGKHVSPNAAERRPAMPAEAPEFVRDVLGPMSIFEGDDLPVSVMPADGTFPSGTARWEKRNIALEIPVWDADLCIQCGKCVMVCPHAVIRAKVYDGTLLAGAPSSFISTTARFKELPNTRYTLQVAPEDCTGCALCVEVCPAKDKRDLGRKALNLAPQPPLREREKANWDFFLTLPDAERSRVAPTNIKNLQLAEPLFEFSGACSGCGETPYVKLLTQLFGDRVVAGNATGCSSIYGGNLPTTPWSANKEGRGPAWSNSLFEDCAEFALGFRLAIDKQAEYARELAPLFMHKVGKDLVTDLLGADQSTEAGIVAQRKRIALLKERLRGIDGAQAQDLLTVADALARKSVWGIGGDGWAYDIGYGGLDHVIASGRNINLLVLDTEVYSNTGGQSSKSTPRGAVAKFAALGKTLPKKDLGLIAMAYGYVYVAQVALGADDTQTLRAFREAEAYDGPSLIIAYSPCINHGIDMRKALDQQKLAVQSGHWPLYRFNPLLAMEGKNPLLIDSKEPTVPLEQYIYGETRYQMLVKSDKARAAALLKAAQREVRARWDRYQRLAGMPVPIEEE